MLQADGFIGLPLVINEQRKIDFGFLAEEAGIFLITKSDYGDGGPFFTECCCEFAQLRDMLSAENSTIMPQKDQHHRSFFPQRTKARGVAVRVWERDVS